MPTVFNCSMCSAPLDVAKATGAAVRCPYCGNTSILPEELRGASGGGAAASGGSFGSLGSMVDQAIKMAEVTKLARAGNKIGAIKLYRETFGTSLQDAKEAVEQLERGQPIHFSHADFQASNIGAQPLQAAQLMAQAASPGAKRIGRWIVVFILLLVAVPLIIVAVSLISAFKTVQHTTDVISKSIPVPSSTPNTAPSFATTAFEFGSEGIGAGQFKDARSIAVDGEGRIYVGEYSLGRVQVFDAQGKFLTQWMVDPKKALLNLAVDRKGIVYVVHPSQILRYEGATGNRLGEVAKPATGRSEFYSDAFVALDGSLYAIGSNSNIIHLGPDGQVRSIIDVRQKIGDDVDFDKLAVNGSGYIYALETHEQSVYKFAPDGKFLNKFGGKGKEKGQLASPHNIATDGQGRVYVSDLGRGVQVFDSNGRFIDSFGDGEVIFGLAINDRGEIFAADRNSYKVVKYVPGK